MMSEQDNNQPVDPNAIQPQTITGGTIAFSNITAEIGQGNSNVGLSFLNNYVAPVLTGYFQNAPNGGNCVGYNSQCGSNPRPSFRSTYPDMNEFRNLTYFNSQNKGQCNNGNCTNNNCNCGNANCFNCTINGRINCQNCDGQAWLQANCNCACTMNCNYTSYSVACNCNCNCNC